MNTEEIFARGAWKAIRSEEDISWVEKEAQVEFSDTPLGDFGSIIKEMLDKGVSPNSIARLVKLAGYETLFKTCYHLSDPNASFEGFSNEVPKMEWALFQIDSETGQPQEEISCIYESLLGMDPSGKEMRPKNA